MAEWNKKYCALVLILAISSVKCSEHKSDKYVTSSKAECLSSKSLFYCVKYKTARFIWSLAIGRVQLDKLFNSERFNLVKIASDEGDNEFPEYRYDQDGNEKSKALSFLKRSVHMFLAAHGFQISFDNDMEARLLSDSHSQHSAVAEIRGKKKRKLKVMLPLLILFKMVAILLGIGGIQLLLVGGGLFLYQYLRNCAQTSPQTNAQSNPQCNSSPVTAMRTVADAEPEPAFSSYAYRYNTAPYQNSASTVKNWANNRPYSAYNSMDVDPLNSSA